MLALHRYPHADNRVYQIAEADMTSLRVFLLTLAFLALAACDRREAQPVEPSEAATTVAPPSPDTQSTGSTAPAPHEGGAMDTPPEDTGADTNTNNIPPAAREEDTAPSDPPDN
jgi:hypothetical protein